MYLVTWTTKGPNKAKTVKALRKTLGLTLADAYNFQQKVQLPFIILDGVDISTANLVKDLLSEAGSAVNLAESNTKQPMIFYRPDLLHGDPYYSDSPIVRAIYRFLFPRR